MEDLENNNLDQALLSAKDDKHNQTVTTMAENDSFLPNKDEELLENSELDLSSHEHHIYDLPDVEQVTQRVQCKLLTVSIVCTVLMIAEIIGGLLAGSLAIMTDAAHLFSDLSGFFISIFSLWLTKQPSTKKLTYGYHRAEVIGALASIILIWGLTIWLITEAVQRVIHRNFEIDRYFMLGTAVFGLLCNLLMGKILHGSGAHHHHGHGHDHGHDHGHSHDHDHKDHEHDHSHKDHEPDHSHKDHDHKEKKEKKDKKNKKNKTEISSSNQVAVIKIDESHKAHDHEDHEDHDHEHKHEQQEHDHEHHHEHEDDHDHDHDHEHDNKHSLEKNDANELKNEKIKTKEKTKNLSMVSDHDNPNLRAAMIHIIGDTVQSIGVIIAALIIFFAEDMKLADPICTFIFAILVIFTTVPVVKDCTRVLMEGVPVGIAMHEFEENLEQIPGVKELHDLHVWSLSVGKPAMSAHIFSENPSLTLKEATKLCRRYGIYHSTLQIENWHEKDDKDFIKCSHNLHD